jgi:hypothetical protein
MAIKWAIEVGSLEFLKIFVIERIVGQWLLFLSMAFALELY